MHARGSRMGPRANGKDMRNFGPPYPPRGSRTPDFSAARAVPPSGVQDTDSHSQSACAQAH